MHLVVKSFSVLTIVGVALFVVTQVQAQQDKTVVGAPAVTKAPANAGKVPATTAAKKPAPAAKKGYGHIFFNTNIGSFKLLGGGEDKAEGAMAISFTGSLMISGLEGTAVPSGNLRLEYSSDKQQRKVYFGTGSLKITGKVRAIQFFGRNMKGDFNGWGIFRLYGEFDNKLETGTFYYSDDPSNKQSWLNGGMQATVPPRRDIGPRTAKPKVRINGG